MLSSAKIWSRRLKCLQKSYCSFIIQPTILIFDGTIMILAAEKDKIDFLKECHKHISRIYNTYLTDSERQDAAPDATHNTPHLTESDEKLSGNLPKSIEFGGWLHNVKMGKLYLLVSIYNEAAKKVEAGESIDLNTFFPKIKRDQDFTLGSRIHTDSNTLMQTHRSHFFRTGFFSFLSYFFKPKSEAFLKKYGFFESESKLPLIEAVRDLKTDRVRALVSPNTVNQEDNYGYGDTPLTVAAYRGDSNITQILIDNGALVDSDALNAAIQAGNIDVVRLLLSKGGNINHPDTMGTTPLRQAIHYISYAPFQDRLGSTWSVRVDIINELLKQHINWDAHSKDGESIFDYAEATKKSFISSWHTHPNRAGLETACETIRTAQESRSHQL